jgi:hypothetical protein
LRLPRPNPADLTTSTALGGTKADFDVMGWKPDDRLRALAISLAKNTGGAGKFHRLKNGTFGLRSWYDEDLLKKAAAGAEVTAKIKTRKQAAGKAARAKAAETKTNGQATLLCPRGCGKPPHRGGCKPIADKLKSSAKTKSQPEAEPDSGKEAGE